MGTPHTGNGHDIHSRLRASGLLIVVGLIIEALCLVWSRPLAFVLLVCLGGLLILAGVATFLYSLISAPSAGPE
jgi:hypothetical protein